MGPTTAPTDVEHQIATIRCLLAQQIQAFEPGDRSGARHRNGDDLLRQLLRREEDLRRRLTDATPVAPRR